VPGTLLNANTLDDFKERDKAALLQGVARAIWDDVASGAALAQPERLLRFLLLTFADLKTRAQQPHPDPDPDPDPAPAPDPDPDLTRTLSLPLTLTLTLTLTRSLTGTSTTTGSPSRRLRCHRPRSPARRRRLPSRLTPRPYTRCAPLTARCRAA